MPEKALVVEILDQMLDAAKRVERRFEGINNPDDFINNDAGKDKLDGICMMLIAIGESLKHLDKITDGMLLSRHPDFDWKGAKGVRDVISHHYIDLDPEVVYAICRERLPVLIIKIQAMKSELK